MTTRIIWKPHSHTTTTPDNLVSCDNSWVEDRIPGLHTHASSSLSADWCLKRSRFTREPVKPNLGTVMKSIWMDEINTQVKPWRFTDLKDV
jgi:hypothetical protein